IETIVTVSRPPSAALQEIASSRAANSVVPSGSNSAYTAVNSLGPRSEGLVNPFSDRTNVRDACLAIEEHLRLMVPFSLFVLYIYDTDSDALTVAHATGEMATSVQGLKIAVGERISGWVAANRTAVLNSDPVLDLGQIAKNASPPLRSCLSVPLVS